LKLVLSFEWIVFRALIFVYCSHSHSETDGSSVTENLPEALVCLSLTETITFGTLY